MAPPQLLGNLYDEITRVVDQAGPDGLARPTRTAAWDVGELLLHLLLDAPRALVALSTPADGPPDVDAVTNWHAFRPSEGDGTWDDRTAVLIGTGPQALSSAARGCWATWPTGSRCWAEPHVTVRWIAATR